jgi:hypothetical protein
LYNDPTGHDLRTMKFADGGVCPGSPSRCEETYNYVHDQAEKMRADGMSAKAMAEIWANGDNYRADMDRRLRNRGLDPNPGRSDMVPDSNRCLLGTNSSGGCLGAGVGRFALEFGKNVGVSAAAMSLIGAVCATTAGTGCGIAAVLAIGGVGGAPANVAGEEVLDCVSGEGCLEFPLDEMLWDAGEGAFLGSTGTGLGYHAARTVGASASVVSLKDLVFNPDYGLTVAIETAAVQWFPRVERALLHMLGNGLEG